MEEQNKQSEQELQEVKEPAGEEPKKEQGAPMRSSIIMLLAGLYLLYTGYQLCKNVLDGVEGSGWGFFAAGVGFLIVGVVMLVISGRDLMKREKAKREAQAEEQIQEQPEPAEPKKSMSIAQRAHLADGLQGDTEDDSENQEETSSEEASDNKDAE